MATAAAVDLERLAAWFRAVPRAAVATPPSLPDPPPAFYLADAHAVSGAAAVDGTVGGPEREPEGGTP